MRGYSACLVAVLALGCSEGEYDVVVRFDPPSLGASAQRIEVGFVPSCDAQELGADPVSGDVITIRRMEESQPLGSFTPGRYGLYGRAFGGACDVVAAGCADVELEAGGSGELGVVLAAVSAAGCPTGTACVGDACVTVDAGEPDGGPADAATLDAGPDAGEVDAATPLDAGGDTDAGPDAGNPDDAGMDAGPCGGSCDDSNPCTEDICSVTGCVHVNDDSNTCGGGTCHAGACCTGCWDGSACRAGSTPAACGAAGGACSSCACPTNACVAGACAPADTAASLGLGQNHTCVVGASGRLYCWGDNAIGQLGDGTIGGDRTAPGQVGSETSWLQVVGGQNTTCGLRSPGTLWCWGDNDDGELLQGDLSDRQLPTRVGTASSWTAVDTYYDHVCALSGLDELWCGGQNSNGELGLGDVTERHVPTSVAGSWASSAPGLDHTCAVRPTGTLFCWGANALGQLGVGDTTDRLSPTQVGTSSTWASVASGESYSCALDTAGALYCFGDNHNGNFGDGTVDTLAHPTPVRVAGTATFTSFSVGEDTTCGIRPDGSLWCWGENDTGEVGIGAGSTSEPSPVRVGTANDWISVDLGLDHVCGIRTGGALWCWGDNTYGQVGNGTHTMVLAPTRVCFPLP